MHVCAFEREEEGWTSRPIGPRGGSPRATCAISPCAHAACVCWTGSSRQDPCKPCSGSRTIRWFARTSDPSAPAGNDPSTWFRVEKKHLRLRKPVRRYGGTRSWDASSEPFHPQTFGFLGPKEAVPRLGIPCFRWVRSCGDFSFRWRGSIYSGVRII